MVNGIESAADARLIELRGCTRGATATSYVMVLGLVALVGGAAFSELNESVRAGLANEVRAASEAAGEDTDAPTGSLAAEVAGAAAEQLAVQGAWALAAKAGTKGMASARKKQRGRGSVAFNDRGNGQRPDDDTRPRSPDSPDDPPNKPKGCFVAGTMVLTPDGLRPIESIAQGDYVLSQDEETREAVPQRVLAVLAREASSLLAVTVADPEGARATLHVTPEHPFYVPMRGWVGIGELAVGQVVLGRGGTELRIAASDALPEAATVFNFEVEQTHSYFVGELSALVHNAERQENLGTFTSSSSNETVELTKFTNPDGKVEVWTTENGKRVGSQPVAKYKVESGRDGKVLVLELIDTHNHPGLGTYVAKVVVDDAAKQGASDIQVPNATPEQDRFYESLNLKKDNEEIDKLLQLHNFDEQGNPVANPITREQAKGMVFNRVGDTHLTQATIEQKLHDQANDPNKPRWTHEPPRDGAGGCKVQ